MQQKRLNTLFAFVICPTFLLSTTALSQTNNEDSEISNLSLFQEISEMDSLLFSAYNNLEIDKYASLVSDDIEFFHDKNGLMTSKKKMVESLEKIAAASSQNDYFIERKLIENTMEVHTISGVGALQSGEHQFIEMNGKGDTSITQAKFIHLWTKQDGNWLVTKVFSYDHQQKKEKINPDKEVIRLSSEQINLYVGDYQFSPEFVLSIVREGSKLFGVAQGDKIAIIPYELHKFLIARDNSNLEFILDDNGNIGSLEMQTGNGVMKAEKVKN